MHTTDKRARRGRGVTINLRADQAKRALIDRAAEKVGKNRSEFMLEGGWRILCEELSLTSPNFADTVTLHPSSIGPRTTFAGCRSPSALRRVCEVALPSTVSVYIPVSGWAEMSEHRQECLCHKSKGAHRKGQTAATRARRGPGLKRGFSRGCPSLKHSG